MRDAGGVGVVVRLERDDLVAGLAQREQRGGDRLGRAGGDEHLAVGVELEPVEAPLVRGDRRAQLRDARARRVLVVAARGSPRPPPRAPRLGPSVSGKPWPRLIAPVRAASADISAKIVVPKPASLPVRSGAGRAAMRGEPRASARPAAAGRAPRAPSPRTSSNESSRSRCTRSTSLVERRSTSSPRTVEHVGDAAEHERGLHEQQREQRRPQPPRVAAAAPRAAPLAGVGERAAAGTELLDGLAGCLAHAARLEVARLRRLRGHVDSRGSIEETPAGPAARRRMVRAQPARRARLRDRGPRRVLPVRGARRRFEDFGINVHVLQPGERSALYHARERAGGLPRARRRVHRGRRGAGAAAAPWDYLHCPAGTAHA